MSLNWKGRRVAVTGATGMTGRILVEKLLGLGARVRVTIRPGGDLARLGWLSQTEVVQGDLQHEDCCARLVEGVDQLFHLASHRRNVAFHHDRAGEVSQANVAMTLALLRALGRQPAIPVTFFSTANIAHGSHGPDPLALEDKPSVDGYVLGKYAAELLWLAAARERSFRLLIARPVGIYGPGDWFSEDGNVIPSLMVKASQPGQQQLAIWGSGRQERSFLYAEDVVGALLCLLDNGVAGVRYISPPETITVAGLAACIRNLIRPDLPLYFDTSRPEGASSLQRPQNHPCLEGFPWTSIAEGTKHTWAWWTANR